MTEYRSQTRTVPSFGDGIRDYQYQAMAGRIGNFLGATWFAAACVRDSRRSVSLSAGQEPHSHIAEDASLRDGAAELAHQVMPEQH
ncbi:hypothetical protein M8I34_21075 [Streptomyces sp. MCA2]|nr:hypothetical protein [Streptomyces sp. MCA2]MCL7493866.1 hypothetical protein [Streptomyces sp. MCA2]